MSDEGGFTIAAEIAHKAMMLWLYIWPSMIATGRLEERGGGWYRWDGETVRGKAAVVERIQAERVSP